MECYSIKQTIVSRSSRLFGDLLYHFDRVQSFYRFNPFDNQSFYRAAGDLNYPEDRRAAVAAVLEEQAARFEAGAQSRRNLERFRRGAAAVVTGQQAGLFTGPAFAFYKALTAIRLADWLTDRGLDCVPIFWLATEDHDLAEVNHAYLLDGTCQIHRIANEGAPHVPNAPVGAVELSSAIAGETEELLRLLPSGPWTPELAAALRDSYRPGETFGSAFGRLMARLLERFGVILLDPMHAGLRTLSAGLFRQVVESAGELSTAVLERNKELIKAGYHAQVHVTEQSTLLFHTVDGQRTALRRANHDFSAGNAPIGKAQLLADAEQHPEKLSPNVLLRPIVQDLLLPTVSYVGGPSELAYMAQAAPLYSRLLGRMPVIFPRASFTLLDRPLNELLERYQLAVTDVLAGPQALREKMGPRFLPAGMAAAFTQDESRLRELLAGVQHRMGGFDRTLADAAATAARKMSYQLAKIKRKAGRAAARQSGEMERDAELLENAIHPRKELQERVYSGISFLARFGPQLLDRLYERIALDSPDHQVLVLEGSDK